MDTEGFNMKNFIYLTDFEQVEFKRLQEQVRDVSFNLRNRFRTSAYQVSFHVKNYTFLFHFLFCLNTWKKSR